MFTKDLFETLSLHTNSSLIDTYNFIFFVGMVVLSIILDLTGGISARMGLAASALAAFGLDGFAKGMFLCFANRRWSTYLYLLRSRLTGSAY